MFIFAIILATMSSYLTFETMERDRGLSFNVLVSIALTFSLLSFAVHQL